MTFDTQTLMATFFILLLAVSFYKIRQFIPLEQLDDDDTTDESQNDLEHLMLKVIKNNNGNLTNISLFEKMLEDDDFESQRFWRFNHNKLNQLLNRYYIKNPDAQSIMEIYEKVLD